MRLLLCSFLLFGLQLGINAEDLDGLFDQPGADIVATTPVATPVATPVGPSVSVSGSTGLSAGLAVGQNDWGGPPVGAGLYSMDGSISFDARLDSRFRSLATIVTSSTGVAFTTPTLAEFFVDYTFADTVLFRVGKASLSWGQGRLFNPADIVSDVGDGISFKAFFPVFGQSLTTVVLAKPEDVYSPSKPSWRELNYAAQLSGDLGPIGWGLAGRTRPGIDLGWRDRRVSAFAKTVIFEVDSVVEVLWSGGEFHPLYSLYWEKDQLKVQAEATESVAGIALKFAWIGTKPVFRWIQYLKDGSGSLTSGIEIPMDGVTKLTFGLPVIFGSKGSLAMDTSSDIGKRRWQVGTKVSLSANF